MKIQDSIFIAVLAILLLLRKPKWFAVAGVASLIVSIPLFTVWIFFTAQRLIWYAAAFFFLSLLFSLRRPGKVQ
ncbi:hypothetical protein HY950_01775 [Candidatus Gottesmanbacteria bacterium]|nr:hypothetical protein [Candidatus Gottesmanbacteria bacterium]